MLFVVKYINSFFSARNMTKTVVTLADLVRSDFRKGSLCGIPLLGGTLVEYKGGRKFGVEWGRGTIKRAGIEGDNFVIRTDDPNAFLTHTFSPEIIPIRVEKKGEILYLDGTPSLYCYAIAPHGVKIPKNPSYHEVVARR